MVVKHVREPFTKILLIVSWKRRKFLILARKEIGLSILLNNILLIWPDTPPPPSPYKKTRNCRLNLASCILLSNDCFLYSTWSFDNQNILYRYICIEYLHFIVFVFQDVTKSTYQLNVEKLDLIKTKNTHKAVLDVLHALVLFKILLNTNHYANLLHFLL